VTVAIALVLVVLGTACGNGGRKAGQGPRSRQGGTPAGSIHPLPTVTPNRNLDIPSSAFQENSWGYVGCSNTHDTIWGYQRISDSAHLFWPFEGYHIEGTTVVRWANPDDIHWGLFDQFSQQFDGGSGPPVIWFQMCESLDPSTSFFARTTFDDVKSTLDLLKHHAPNAIVFISPLQSYDPPTLCPWMGPGGEAVPHLTDLANQAVDQGLAQAGPGVGGNTNLGPLTQGIVDPKDDCHPNGGPHGPGPGAQALGQQLHEFFDSMK
jgi:hypothetical protein